MEYLIKYFATKKWSAKTSTLLKFEAEEQYWDIEQTTIVT